MAADVSLVAADVFLDTMEFVSKSLASILTLHGQDVLEGLLLRAQDLDFLLVSAEGLTEVSASFGKIVEFTLKMGRVLRSTLSGRFHST